MNQTAMPRATVLQVMAYAAPYMGNFVRSLLFLDRRLRTVGIPSIYLLPEAARHIPWVTDLMADGTKIHFYPESYGGLPAHWRLLHDLVVREDVTIIHAHFWPPKFAPLLRLIRWRHPHVNVVWHHHNHYGVHAASAVMRRVKKAVLDFGVADRKGVG